jgi:hypothetical protein
MFSTPILHSGQTFPELSAESPEFREIIHELDIHLDLNKPALPQLAVYAVGWIAGEPAYAHPEHTLPYHQVAAHHRLADAGLVRKIPPPQFGPTKVVTDGGSTPVYDYRLDSIDKTISTGEIQTDHIGIFAGQRLRFAADDALGRLETIALELREKVEPWSRNWLDEQLRRCPTDPDIWQRPFASEHEVAIHSVIRRYGARLEHIKTISRPNAVSIHPSIPAAPIATEVFGVDDREIYVLNAPAIYRQHAGHMQPVEKARPTGRSAFFEWMDVTQPAANSNVLLVSHNPNIYRSWLDLLLAAAERQRQDLRLAAAGPAIERHRSFGYLLRGLGNIVINMYNHDYEHGKSAPNIRNKPL